VFLSIQDLSSDKTEIKREVATMSNYQKVGVLMKGISDGIPANLEGRTIYELQDMLRSIKAVTKKFYKECKRLDRQEAREAKPAPVENEPIILMPAYVTETIVTDIVATKMEEEPQGRDVAFVLKGWFAIKKGFPSELKTKVLTESDKAYQTPLGWIPKSQVVSKQEVA
jgi:hypothetical protein